jgi:EcsC protein family
MVSSMSDWPPDEGSDLARARAILEHPGVALRITEYLGAPVESLLRRLPDGALRTIGAGTRAALERSLDLALRTLDRGPGRPTSDWLHRGVVAASGAVGGALGLAGLLLELPFSMTVMLRSIADHARAAGEDLSGVAPQLECLAVFAYGSRSARPSQADYLAARLSLGRLVTRASEFIAERGVGEALSTRSAPALARLVGQIAERFGGTVAEKAAAQLVPVAGALGGAAINTLFMTHYQETAWAHFTIRRLERLHGPKAVEDAFLAARSPS